MLCVLAGDVGFWGLCRSVPEIQGLHYTRKFKAITHICGEIPRECRATFRHSSVSPNRFVFGLPTEMPCCHEYTTIGMARGFRGEIGHQVMRGPQEGLQRQRCRRFHPGDGSEH